MDIRWTRNRLHDFVNHGRLQPVCPAANFFTETTSPSFSVPHFDPLQLRRKNKQDFDFICTSVQPYRARVPVYACTDDFISRFITPSALPERGCPHSPGLLEWNCRHTYYPFIKGVSQRAYSDQWLADMDRKEAQTKTFRGKEYNTYQATQKQRSMETAMRAQRQKVQLLEQGKADPDDIITAKCKYQARLGEYKEFRKKFNLPKQREQIYADLRGRVAPSQQTYKQWQAEQAKKRPQGCKQR